MNRWLWAVCLPSLLAACSFKDSRIDHCDQSNPCQGGQTCEQGFCITVETGRSPAMNGNKDSSVDTRRDSGSAERIDASMRPDSQPSAASDAAVSSMPDAAPSTDCEEGATRSCMLAGAAAGCRVGTQRCQNGVFGTCTPTETPQPETCDGIDEDCDGKVDEEIVVDCYPANAMGCTSRPNMPWSCQGSCATGKQTCQNGKLSACLGAVTPVAEACATSGAANDENCNGMTDETCMCNQGETRPCYPGATNTLNVGKCKAGTQVCNAGALGACMGAVMPATETCANEGADDNCDGVADNVLNRGAPCTVASNQGICKSGKLECKGTELSCLTNPPAAAEACNGQDDDCDGKLDETFNLQTDAMNCGACGTRCGAGDACCAGKCVNLQEDEANCGACGATHACATGSSCCKGVCVDTTQDGTSCGACGIACTAGQTCCGGQCVDSKTDPKHCGSCTNACSMGMQPGCCDGVCVDLLSPQNCGGCGQACGVLDGGVQCTCSMTATGGMCVSSPGVACQ